jgi:hypothetical protein
MNHEDTHAFPGIAGDESARQPGMTLRDYFAASALQGLATRRPAGTPTSAGELARFAFEIADAMLAERAK